jgi:hypothetical protein
VKGNFLLLPFFEVGRRAVLGRGKKHYVAKLSNGNALRPDRDPRVNDLAIPLKSIDFAAIWAIQS